MLADYTRFMKIRTIIVSLFAMLCMIGCSKHSGMVSKSKGLVPATAAEVAASPDFKLEQTTKSGLKIYIRELTPEIAKTISVDSPDFSFLQGDGQYVCFFEVLIRGGKIVDADKADDGLKPEDVGELLSFTMQHIQKGH